MHPLLENYEKYYGKKEKPKIPRIEDYEGEKTIADELKEIKEVSSLSKEQHEVLAHQTQQFQLTQNQKQSKLLIPNILRIVFCKLPKKSKTRQQKSLV